MSDHNAISTLRDLIPEFARDARLNLGSVLSDTGAPGLTLNQIFGIALSSAHALKDQLLSKVFHEAGVGVLSDQEVEATKIAATIMAMTNVYYRTLHLAVDSELKKLPAKLRMNGLANHGIAKVDFELYALAVSALSGCSSCITAHIHEARKQGVTNEGIQSVIRIAAVVHSVSQALAIGAQN